MVIRLLALFLSLSLGLSTAPAFALRNQTTEGAGLEEKLTQALQEGDPVKAAKTVVSHFAQIAVPPRAPLVTPAVVATGLEELKDRLSAVSDQSARALAEAVYDAVTARLDPAGSLERNLRAAVQAVAQTQAQHPQAPFTWMRAGTKGSGAFIAFEVAQIPVVIWFDQGQVRDVAIHQEAARQLSYTALLGGQVGPKEFSEEFKRHHLDEPTDFAITYTTGQILDQLLKRNGRVALVLTSKPKKPEENKKEVAERFARGWVGRYDGNDPMTFLWMIPERVDIYFDVPSDPGEKLRQRLISAGMTIKGVFATPEEVGEVVAEEISKEWQEKDQANQKYVFGLVTGSTPKPFLAALMPKLRALPPAVRSGLLQRLQIVVPDDHVDQDAAGHYQNITRSHPVSAYTTRENDFIQPANEGLPADLPGMSIHQVVVPEVGKVDDQLQALPGFDRYFMTFGPQHVFMQFAGEADNVRLYDPQGLISGKRVVVIQNSAEPAGVFGQVPASLELPVQVIRADDPRQGRLIPSDPSDWDWENIAALVVMGGPPNVHENPTYPWLDDLTRLLRYTTERQIPTLGVCLGCQLLAHAVGGEVTQEEVTGSDQEGKPIKTLLTPSAPRGIEKGFVPVAVTPAGQTHPFLSGLPSRFNVAELHGDTVYFPPGATLQLADGTAAPVRLLLQGKQVPWQAFAIGDRVIGVLGHPEASPEIFDEWLQVPDNEEDEAAIRRMGRLLGKNEAYRKRQELAAQNWWKIVEESWLERHLRRPEVTGTGGEGIRARFLTGSGRTYDALILDNFPQIPELRGGLSPLLTRFEQEAVRAGIGWTWVDLATGLGTAPREAQTLNPNLRLVLIDVVRWKRSDLPDHVALAVEKRAAKLGIDDVWSMEGIEFIQGDVAQVKIPHSDATPTRIVSIFQAISYNTDPLKILTHIYNQLPDGALLLANFYIPTGYDAQALGIPQAYAQPENLISFWRGIFQNWRDHGIRVETRIKDHRVELEPIQGFEGHSPEFQLAMFIEKAPGTLDLNLKAHSVPVQIQGSHRLVEYQLAWYEGDLTKPFTYLPAAGLEEGDRRRIEAMLNQILEWWPQIEESNAVSLTQWWLAEEEPDDWKAKEKGISFILDTLGVAGTWNGLVDSLLFDPGGSSVIPNERWRDFESRTFDLTLEIREYVQDHLMEYGRDLGESAYDEMAKKIDTILRARGFLEILGGREVVLNESPSIKITLADGSELEQGVDARRYLIDVESPRQAVVRASYLHPSKDWPGGMLALEIGRKPDAAGLEEPPGDQTPFARGRRLIGRLAPYGVQVWQGLVQADDPGRVASDERVASLVEKPEGMEFTLDIPMDSATIRSLSANLPKQFTLWVHPTLKDAVPAHWGLKVEVLPEKLEETRAVLREKVRAGDLVLLDKRNYEPSVHRSWKALLAEAARQGLWVTEGELSTMDRDEFAITLQILRNSGEVLPAVGPEQEIEGTQHRFIYA